MIDSTNDNNKDLLLKYDTIVDLIKHENNYINFLSKIDHAVDYINTNYPNVSIAWKSWCIVFVKNLYFKHNKDLNNIDDIINNFYDYKNKNYIQFLETIEWYQNDYQKDYSFISKLLKESI